MFFDYRTGYKSMKWLMLPGAGVFEIVQAVAMKYSQGFSLPVPSVITAAAYILSAVFLAFALKELPLGSACAMWVGFGITGTAFFGVMLFNERLSVMQVVSPVLIIAGVAGLKLFAESD